MAVSVTIRETFQASDLPTWALRFRSVIQRCRQDHAFRCAVYGAETVQYRQSLVSDADRWLDRLTNS